MKVDLHKNEDGTVILTGDATVHYVERLYEQLKDLLQDAPDHLIIDLGKMQSIDLAGAQVLIAFKRSVAPTTVSLRGCSESVYLRLERTGLLAPILGEPYNG
ncbi:MAG: STAS domain-containing protein [Myxococcota bacterium]|nr:STAS domain-containing protein [Myxococcota bacterium]